MAKKYVNCPICGGMASYLSANWEQAGIIITDEKLHYADDIKKLTEYVVRLELYIQNKVGILALSSTQLLELYMMAVRRETVEEQERKDEEAMKMEEDLRKNPHKYRFGIGGWGGYTELK